MEQLLLLGDDVTQKLLTHAKPVKLLTCAHLTPWSWPHDCAACAAAVEESCRRFDEMVAAGKYNTRGYTRNEWKRAGHSAATWRVS